jgi:hypothetical protein
LALINHNKAIVTQILLTVTIDDNKGRIFPQTIGIPVTAPFFEDPVRLVGLVENAPWLMGYLTSSPLIVLSFKRI